MIVVIIIVYFYGDKHHCSWCLLFSDSDIITWIKQSEWFLVDMDMCSHVYFYEQSWLSSSGISCHSWS